MQGRAYEHTPVAVAQVPTVMVGSSRLPASQVASLVQKVQVPEEQRLMPVHSLLVPQEVVNSHEPELQVPTRAALFTAKTPESQVTVSEHSTHKLSTQRLDAQSELTAQVWEKEHTPSVQVPFVARSPSVKDPLTHMVV